MFKSVFALRLGDMCCSGFPAFTSEVVVPVAQKRPSAGHLRHSSDTHAVGHRRKSAPAAPHRSSTVTKPREGKTRCARHLPYCVRTNSCKFSSPEGQTTHTICFSP